LDRYPVVLLGEDHWRREAGAFYISLVTNPEFPQHANTLVLECGNSLDQPVLDRYENGEDVPFAEISQVWRNTTKVLSWDSPIYANLIAAMRGQLSSVALSIWPLGRAMDLGTVA